VSYQFLKYLILKNKNCLQDINKFDKSILNEAKVLARTFEELALKTDSGCKHYNLQLFF